MKVEICTSIAVSTKVSRHCSDWLTSEATVPYTTYDDNRKIFNFLFHFQFFYLQNDFLFNPQKKVKHLKVSFQSCVSEIDARTSSMFSEAILM